MTEEELNEVTLTLPTSSPIGITYRIANNSNKEVTIKTSSKDIILESNDEIEIH